MNRKDFITNSSLLSLGMLASVNSYGFMGPDLPNKLQPLAITMWDFSWLERRWDGAGYEDWDKILDELKERGYNAVRIDAYPHLVAADAKKEWTLIPAWEQNDWGSPGIIKVKVMPSLIEFIGKCKKRNIKVGLSSWYREDADNIRMTITTPEKMAANWLVVLHAIASENLLDSILYVDLCNEWMASPWVLYLKNVKGMVLNHDWRQEASLAWMKASIEILAKQYPQLPYTFSMDSVQAGRIAKTPTPFLDFMEPHVWMAGLNEGEFNNKVGINWDGFSSGDWKRTAAKAEPLYNEKKAYWNNILTSEIIRIGKEATEVNHPLITTECWAIVNYKDYPSLPWQWVKDVCALGVTTAAATGQWVAIATSNFCGPQFVGMWRDIAWHKQMTNIIKQGKINEPLLSSKLCKRMAR